MAYDTSIRDAAVRRERAGREELRRRVLAATRAALDELSQEFGITKAFLFGSVVRKHGFRPESDVDIAVEGVEDTLGLATRLSRRMNREVHVVICGESLVARRARHEGIEWTPGS